MINNTHNISKDMEQQISITTKQDVNVRKSKSHIYKKYTQDDIKEALALFLNGMRMKEIRKRYPNVPERTIYNRYAAHTTTNQSKDEIKSTNVLIKPSNTTKETNRWSLDWGPLNPNTIAPQYISRKNSTSSTSFTSDTTSSTASECSMTSSGSNSPTIEQVNHFKMKVNETILKTRPSTFTKTNVDTVNSSFQPHTNMYRMKSGKTFPDKRSSWNGNEIRRDNIITSNAMDFRRDALHDSLYGSDSRELRVKNKRKVSQTSQVLKKSKSIDTVIAHPMELLEIDNERGYSRPSSSSHQWSRNMSGDVRNTNRQIDILNPIDSTNEEGNESNSSMYTNYLLLQDHRPQSSHNLSYEYPKQSTTTKLTTNMDKERNFLEIEKLRCDVAVQRIQICVAHELGRKQLLDIGLTPHEAEKILSRSDDCTIEVML